MSTYMIDKDYHILYYDEGTKKRFPEIKPGDICYEIFNGTDRPCEGCRCRETNVGKLHYVNRKIQKNLEVQFVPLSGGREEGTVLVHLDEMEPGKNVVEDEDGIEEIDLLTGLYRQSTFEKKAVRFLREHKETPWVMVSIDIVHFKLFNAWYGEKAGDRLLQQIGTYFRSLERQKDRICVAGYLGGDDFQAVLPDDEEQIQKIFSDLSALLSDYGTQSSFYLSMGVYRIDEWLSFMEICDRAQIAVSKTKAGRKSRIVWFDDSMLENLEQQQHTLSEVLRGLSNQEFTFYLQPKCNLNTGKIVGMEALARWNHPTRGVVPPLEYIPFLEENGMITDFDLYIWEAVCKEIQSCMKKGGQLLPISVNVSAADFAAVDVTKVFTDLCRRYGIPHKYLEIELTESTYAEGEEVVGQAVQKLREAGFTVLMDDFGSGYSSLNMLKDVSVDILKIDMRFLNLNGENKEKALGILQSVIRLANLMHIRLIAEGVENQEQIDFLLKMGCIYGQGYYYYRPMPIEEMRGLFREKDRLDYRGIRKREIEHINASDLFNENIVSDVILNNILGPVAFYEVQDGVPYTTQVNNQYCRLMGMNLMDMEDKRNRLFDYCQEGDREKLLSGFAEAYENRTEGAVRIIQRKTKDGAWIWVMKRIYFLREYGDCRLFYVACRDMTEEKRTEKRLEEAEAELSRLQKGGRKDDGTDGKKTE